MPDGIIDRHRLVAVSCAIYLGRRETTLRPSKLLQQLRIRLWRDACLGFDQRSDSIAGLYRGTGGVCVRERHTEQSDDHDAPAHFVFLSACWTTSAFEFHAMNLTQA